ncbi:MAG: hypothetical protein J6Y17_03315 [Elusimicrobiaceae bacterium]|nr:hypothetical protein [Elusimicrobiaceae bacterium]
MVLRHLQPSFVGGEISPSLQARVDASSYNTWLKNAQNMFVHPQGGISNRPGMQYQGAAKYTDKKCRLFSFYINEEESYIIEAGEYYFRFYTSNGIVLNAQQTPLEIVTPYSGAEIKKLQTAQYNQTLYFAHPNHPLHRLACTNVGTFTWEEVPLKYGPFQPANTDITRKVRVYPQTQTVESQGVAAQMSFEPVNYSNLMVWAYFNGTCFYVADGYGLNLAEIVSFFNEDYGSQGLQASQQGNILTICSGASDGGDWNGAVFKLEYRSRFMGDADFSVTQTLSGGENAGTQTVAEPGRYILESSFSTFTPSDVGSKFCVVHTVDAQHESGTLGRESVSASIKSGSDWTLRTVGNWTGTLEVEVSSDLGLTWRTLKVLSRVSGDDNFYITGNLNDAENLFYLRVRSCQISGEAEYELAAESFIQRGVLHLLSYVSATQMVAEIERPFGSEEWTSLWALGSFSSAAGYPSCVFFFQERLGLAGTQSEMQTLWFSKTGNLTDFGRARDEQLSTDAMSVCLGGTQLNAIENVLVANRLLIFTTGSEWTLTSSGPLSLDTLQLEQQSQRGAYFTTPVLAGNHALFVQARGSSIRDLVYDYMTSSYSGDDITLRAKHLFFSRKVIQMAYAQEPDHLLWCVADDGALFSITYLPEQGIYAWTHHQTQGKVLSVCVRPYQGQDEVWFLVQRAGGVFLEKLAVRMTDKTPVSQVFLDGSISYQFQTPQTIVSGLSHLEGQDVCALADGNVIAGLTVQNNSVTLPYAAQIVHVGLSYQSCLGTLPLKSVQVQKHRIVNVRVKMIDSRGGKIGVEQGALTPFVQRTDEKYNTAVALQTGEICTALACAHQPTPNLLLVQEDPLPLTVLSIEVQAV